MTPPSLIPGYALHNKIAEGGFAEIYDGEELVSKRKVAIKILHPRHHTNKTEFKRLIAEGGVGMRLRNHENVVRFLQVGRSGRAPYVVMEFIQGRTLREILREQKRLSNQHVVLLAQALASGIRYMHSEGVFHKDIKPENVMLSDEGTIKLIDLGFAESKSSVKWSLFGRSLEGSPAYMAPELLRTKKPSEATDLYALGCTLYEAATGITPFTGLSDNEILQKQLNMSSRPTPVTEANPDITPYTERLIMNALEKHNKDRYKSIDEFLLELRRNPLLSSTQAHVSLPAGWARKRGNLSSARNRLPGASGSSGK
ncbi:MAG: serine/threonine protein kinase [Planctomycetota bacterium]|nr:serine/threonine protein kinase [Planctomycetota bacterium]